MITCKICESDIQAEKLKDHSSKCKEVTELKDNLVQLRLKMENYAEKASAMKNCLETYAAKQRSGSLTLPEIESLQTPKTISRTNSGINDSLLEAVNESVEVAEKTPKRDFGGEFSEFIEPVQKMTNEEYEKFIVEAKKGVFALKKIIAYAHKIHQGGYENDLDYDIKSELEIVYAEIIDVKIGDFLKNFMLDLVSYMDLKEKFAKESEKLAEVSSSPQAKNIKQQFQSKKSRSFKENRGLKFKIPRKIANQFKEDMILNLKGSLSQEHRQYMPKSTLDSREKSAQLKNSESLLSTTPTLKSLNFSGLSGIFQNNSNHVSQRSIFSLGRTNMSGLEAFREKISLSASQSNKENSIKKELIQANLLTNRDKSTNKNSHWTPISATDVGSIHSSGKKEDLSTIIELQNEHHKISIMDITAGIRNLQKGFKANKMRRTSSMDAFNAAHKGEDLRCSLLTKNVSQMAAPNNHNDNDVPDKLSPCRLKPVKKQSSDHSPTCWDSPGMKGYYSDTHIKPKKKTSFSYESMQVTIDDFEPIKYIGQGAYGTVWLVRKKATGDEYAMKIVEWEDRAAQNRLSALKKEKDIYNILKGDNVVKAVWTFHYEHFICFVTEFMIGGDFNGILDNLGRLDEEQARFYFAELVLAVESLHSLGIVHRDLKPENILMDAKGHIRLTDFGLSRAGLDKFRENATTENKGKGISPTQLPTHEDGKKTAFFDKWNKSIGRGREHIEFKTKKNKEIIFDFLKEETPSPALYGENFQRGISKKISIKEASGKRKAIVGTPDYMAPEVIDHKNYDDNYDEKCMDWWSMGAILYQFLVGIPPFCDETIERVFDNIRNYRIEWPSIGIEEDCISAEAVDLIKRLLEPNPNKRFGASGAQEIKNHAFFKNFDWEGLREREAPIIPFKIFDNEPETKSINDVDEEKRKVEFPGSGRGGSTKRQIKQLDLSGFQMRRLDVLDKLNQETYKKLQRQDTSKEKSESSETNRELY